MKTLGGHDRAVIRQCGIHQICLDQRRRLAAEDVAAVAIATPRNKYSAWDLSSQTLSPEVGALWIVLRVDHEDRRGQPHRRLVESVLMVLHWDRPADALGVVLVGLACALSVGGCCICEASPV